MTVRLNSYYNGGARGHKHHRDHCMHGGMRDGQGVIQEDENPLGSRAPHWHPATSHKGDPMPQTRGSEQHAREIIQPMCNAVSLQNTLVFHEAVVLTLPRGMLFLHCIQVGVSVYVYMHVYSHEDFLKMKW